MQPGKKSFSFINPSGKFIYYIISCSFNVHRLVQLGAGPEWDSETLGLEATK